MSYKVKPILKLYKYENSTFVMQAQIDDYSEVSFEHNLYQAGTFTISINYNIPNSQLFQRGLFVQFGNNPGDFGEIYSIQDSISKDGKGSQTRTIVGYDARYILKRRVIKNMNSNGLWVMTAKGELCIRNLIKDQCGVDAEEKRRLPIINNIPDVSEAKGKEYSVSEQFTNLYEVCKTIATQSEIGWRISFINNELNLEIYEGEDLSQTVRFDTNYESLANGKFSDSSESFSNAIYIGGKGQNDSRDIYEGENGSPSGFNRFESWDNQSQMTTEDEYETEAISMLSQYGQTLTITGNGLVKCPYVFREQYNVGDVITVAFSGKSAAAQILSVTEHWSFGNYEINFNFGKPQNNLSDQLQLMLRQIQKASETSNSTESVKWYNVANENTMDSADVTYNTIGFTGAMTSNKTFTFYLDNEKTGAKSYNIYAKNLTGNYNLTLTTGRSGKTNVVLKGGVNITSRILVDEEGNIISQGMTSTSVVESGNNQPVTSDAVYNVSPTLIGQLTEGTSDVTDGTEFVSSYASNDGFADTNDGGPNKAYKRKFIKVWNYIKAKILSWMDSIPTSGSSNPITSGAVYMTLGGTGIRYKDIELTLQSLNWIHYSIDGIYRGYYINLNMSDYIAGNYTPICATQWRWSQLAQNTPFFVGLDNNGLNLSLAIGDISFLTANTKVIIRVWYITY